jgi:hypothetical protein
MSLAAEFRRMNQPEPSPSGLAGSLKVIAGLAVMALAVLAALFVLEVIPHSIFQELLGKVMLLLLIAALAAAALWVLTRTGQR